MAKRKSSKGKRLAPTVTSPAKMGEEMAHAQSTAAESPNVKYAARHAPTMATEPATKSNRRGHQERLGAKYAPQMNMHSPDAAVGSQETGRNVRIVPSAVGNRDFWNKRQFGQVQQ